MDTSTKKATERSISTSLSCSEDTLNEDSYSPPKRDILKVFQAAPLAYFDTDDKPHQIGMLDFELERDILTEALEEAQSVDASIDVSFETATTDRLSAFLARGECEVLHFSCHGHPDYLFIEDGWGAGYPLRVKDLQEWISKGGSNLRFVFVSACHSRSAGEAFLDAGVPHVVCCPRDSHSVSNTAAAEFARAFYRALACGRTLKEAFEFGRNGVLHSGSVKDAPTEASRFALLPQDKNHDVPIFFTKPLLRMLSVKETRPSRSKHFPSPPDPFFGRDLDMFRILQALRDSRLVRVTGQSGSGKCSVVKAICQYICKRDMMDDVFWIPVENKRTCDKIETLMSKIFEQIQSDGSDFQFPNDSTYIECGDEIYEELHRKRSLLIIDARKLVMTESKKKLVTFLEDLFKHTRHARVIVVHGYGDDIRSKNFSVEEDDIEVKPLDFISAVSLFSRLCRRGNRKVELAELVDRLASQHEADNFEMTYRTSQIYKMIGDGIPTKIHTIAKNFDPLRYKTLITLSRRAPQAVFTTRASLEQRLMGVRQEHAYSVLHRDYDRASEIQESIDEMEVQREALPDLQSLKWMSENIELELAQSLVMRDYSSASSLQRKLNQLMDQIKMEIGDYEEADLSTETSSSSSSSQQDTRVGIETNVRKLERALRQACGRGEFNRARSIKSTLERLKLQEENFMSSEQLNMHIGQLRSLMEDAVAHHDLDVAEGLYKKIVDAEDKLNREKLAENDVHDDTCNDSARRAPPDPPGKTFEYGDGVNDLDDESIITDGREQSVPAAHSNSPENRATSSNTAESSPGAFHIQGNVVERRGRSNYATAIPSANRAENGNQRHRNDDTELEAATDRNFETKGDKNDKNTRSLDPFHIGIGQWAVQRFSLESTSFSESDSEIDDVTATSEITEEKPSASIVLWSSPEMARADEFRLEVDEATLVTSSLSRGTRATNTIGSYWGYPWCSLCHRVQIHDTMNTLTKTDTNGNYTVYKGFCLSPGCYTLEEAKTKLGEHKNHVAALNPTKSSSCIDVSVKGRENPRLPVAAVVTPVDQTGIGRRKRAGEEDHSVSQSQIAPYATVVIPQGDEARDKSGNQKEQREREQIEKIVRETINNMTVTATKVEAIEMGGDSIELASEKKSDYDFESLEIFAPG